jgi:hypothetical protein
MTGPVFSSRIRLVAATSSERESLVLHDGDVEAVGAQEAVHALPARAVHEAAVNQNDRGKMIVIGRHE